jgi:thymidylate synthase
LHFQVNWVFSLGDAHIYKTHIAPLQVQLNREPKRFPIVKFKRSLDELLEAVASVSPPNDKEGTTATSTKADAENNKYVRALEAITEDDLIFEGYECWPAIKMEMSV